MINIGKCLVEVACESRTKLILTRYLALSFLDMY